MIKITKYRTLSDILKFKDLFLEKYPNLTESKISEYLQDICKTNDYSLLIAEDSDNNILAMCGFHIGTMIYCGKFIQVTSLYVKQAARNQGIAQQLLNNIEIEGKKNNCDNIVLDSFIHNESSHDLYNRFGFTKQTYHFMKKIS
ncbi:MAG: GNAT family N-acetyltransferase [Rickettsiales bacterium]|nr:GNAT family N-acetyltransferase [Rickettsiales bacterium]